MKSTLLTSSNFGKFYPLAKTNLRTIELGSTKTLEIVKFTLTSDKLYLLDAAGHLVCLTLSDNSISTLNSAQLHLFEIDSANPFSIISVTRNSDLMRISFENKQITRVMNLNLNRILDFQKNHFTNLLLVIQYKIVMLINASAANGGKIRSIKAANGEKFTGGKFLNQNRFIVVSVRNDQIRILQVMALKTIQKIKLPFEIKALKLETSFDGSIVAVYGDSNVLLLIRVSEEGKLSYQMTELPVKSIFQLKLTYQNDIVFLGHDRLLYGISQNNINRLVPLFNQIEQIRVSAFDISLNGKTVALTSNKSVHLLDLNDGIRHQIEVATEGKNIQFAQQSGGQQVLKVGREIEYDEQQQSGNPLIKKQNSVLQVNLEANLPEQLPNFNQHLDAKELLPEIRQISPSKVKQSYIHRIYEYLRNCESPSIILTHKSLLISFIHKMLSLIPDPQKCTGAVYLVVDQLAKAILDGSLEKYSLILAPRVVEKVQRALNQNIVIFITKNVFTLFGDYLCFTDQVDILKIMLKNGQRESFLTILIISLLLHLRSKSQGWPNPHQQSIEITQVLQQAQNLLANAKNAYIFAKKSPPKEKSANLEYQNLQLMLQKQQKLKHSLQNIRKAI